MEKHYRPTWAEVDLSAIGFNFQQVRKLINKKTKVMAVIKCDAYGHGLLPVAKRLVSLGVDYFGVSSIDEAVALRTSRVSLPILVLGNILNKEINAVFKYKLTQTISERNLAYELNQKAKKKGEIVKVHIKVDTGMGRLGVLHKHALDLIKEVNSFSNLEVEGLFTHLSCADCDCEFTNRQIELFTQLIDSLKAQGINIPLCHAANSMGIIGYSQSHFNLVRPGLMLYGVRPKAELDIKLKPAMSLLSKVIYCKRMPPGEGVSYGRSYITSKETNVIVLPIGYGDGYPRHLSNAQDILIGGKRYKISGLVCMDQIMVDVGEASVRTADEVVLIGSQKNAHISAEELARHSNTIAYEIICGIGARVPRVYIN